MPFTTKGCPCSGCPMRSCHSSERQCQTCAMSRFSSAPGGEGAVYCWGGLYRGLLSCRATESRGINESHAGMWSSDPFLGLLSVAGGHTHVPEQNRHSPKALQRCSFHHLPAKPGRCFNPGGFGYPRELGQAASVGCWWKRDSLEGVWGKPVRH